MTPGLFLRYAGQQLSQRLRVDRDRCALVPALRKFEQRAVQSLVEQTVAVAIPPQHLHAHRPLPDEHVQ